MPLYDARCNECDYTFEELRKSTDQVGQCPQCGGAARTIWTTVPLLDKAKDPYDLISTGGVPDKPIKSFANDRRSGGKNTV